MKIILLVFAFIGLSFFCASAQNLNHPTISTYSLNVIQVGPYVPEGAQTAGLATFMIITSDSSDVAKVWVQGSPSGQSNGSVFQLSYAMGSEPVSGPSGLMLFRQDGKVIVINVIIPDPPSAINYEICTENSSGQKTPYLGQVR